VAATKLRIEIVSATTFAFDVDGAVEPRLEPDSWKEAANPPELERLRVVWEVARARMVAANDNDLWDEWAAFIARFQTRQPTAPPVSVRLVRDPGGANETVWTLGPPTYQEFRFELVRGEATDDQVPSASWRTVAPVSLTFSAVLALADTRGIVTWRQVATSGTTPGGHVTLSWRTEVGTVEGIDARAKARTFAAIPIATLGTFYSYLTNNTDGVDLEWTDADENLARTPTRVVAVSSVQQWGVDVGTAGPGDAPTEVAYTITTERTDARGTRVTREASAHGPNALAWVRGRRPGGALAEEVEVDERAISRASARWVQRFPASGEDAVQETLRVQVRGGAPVVEFEPATGGFAPVGFVTGILPWVVAVAVALETEAGDGARASMTFPPLLGAPLFLDREASQEDAEPWIAEHATDDRQRTYRREATLIYRAAQPPPPNLAALLAAGPRVESYYLA
jgi:hypothetical protein